MTSDALEGSARESVVADAAAAEAIELNAIAAEQDRESIEFASAFLKKVMRIRGVRIERAEFLAQELRKLGLTDGVIAAAIASTPMQAGIGFAELDSLGVASIALETNKSAAMSFAAGLPGGFGMIGAVPADITQYYVHAFRVMQKLAYLYGWQNFIDDLDDIDDETLGKLSVFLGVMLGVGGASASLSRFAQQVARPAIQQQITKQALTKTVWYTPMKQTLKFIGIKLTKDSFAKAVTKAVPVASGVISGAMTLVSLRLQSERLQAHLRELPPPGVDAADHAAALAASGIGGRVGKLTAVKASIGSSARDAAGHVQTAAASTKHTVTDAAGSAARFTASLVGRKHRD